MAFYSMLRRASSSVIPFTIRTVGLRRSLHNTIFTARVAERNSLGPEISRRGLLSLSRFSTATAKKPSADESLIRVLDSEIECAEEPQNVHEFPDGFPFEIHDNPGERTTSLTRQYQDENIKVEVDMPHVSVEEDHDDNDESADPSSIPLVVSISKGNGESLEFGITAFPDEMTIDSLSIKDPKSSDDQLAYEGPDFNDLDENLQKAFHKYLEIRGIKPSMTNFLFKYMENKDKKEYLQWLENIKNFMEK